MRDYLEVYFLIAVINIRWWYFHISPRYIKFYMDSECTEAHFQHTKTGQLHSQVVINFNEDSRFYKGGD